MTRIYETYCFIGKADESAVPVGSVSCFQWENEMRFRPNTFFKMYLCKNRGVYVKMKTDETDLRISCKGRDENCWEDSCMEFFFMPFSDSGRYLNFEMTPACAYLSAVGESGKNRVFLKQLTDAEPKVAACVTQSGWEVSLFIPCELISQVYSREFTACAGEYRGNFYKCADKAKNPHFGSFSPMGTLPPGFHNPELFAKIIVKEAKI